MVIGTEKMEGEIPSAGKGKERVRRTPVRYAVTCSAPRSPDLCLFKGQSGTSMW